jgi:cytochrome c-type biogenesis protein CcmF
VSGAVVDLASRTGRGDITARLRRVMRLPRADWGKAIAHAGLGITIFGIAGLMAWEQEDIRVMNIGDTAIVDDLTIRMDDVEQVRGPNYFSTMGVFTILKDGQELYTLRPEKRVYPVAAMPTTEADIHNGFWRDVYLVIGDAQDSGGFAVRTYLKPFANWIWAGSIIMALGGVFSLSDRRYRVAAGARKTAKASGAVPAE